MTKFLTGLLFWIVLSMLLASTSSFAQSFPNEIFQKPKDCAAALSTPTAWQLPATAEAVDEFIEDHLGRYDLFQQIPWEHLEFPEKFSNTGWNNSGTYSARYQDQEVVVKLIPSRSPGSRDILIREAIWTTFLNAHGLAAKLIGLTKYKEHWALIMKKVPGMNTKDIHFQPSEASMAEMRRQVQILLDLQIDPMDLQFMLDESKGSVVLIDTAMFIWGGESDSTPDELIEEMLRY